MATTRRQKTTPDLADLEIATDPLNVPGPIPPVGTEADVETRIRYRRGIQAEPPPDYPNDLRQLAAEEDENDELPEPEADDPVTAFLSYWQRFAGYHMKVIRLPDPAPNLLPGNSFNRQCRELTMLGTTTFDPLAFEQSLQILNGNSGGVFRVFLLDASGLRVPDAVLDRFIIADPPRRLERSRRDPYYDDEDMRRLYPPREQQTAPLPPPQKSEMEQRIERMQSDLFEKVMLRALDPPPPPVVNPLSLLNEEDRLAVSLLQKGDLLPNIVSRIASLAQQPEKIESSGWKDRMADAAVHLVTNNPAIVTQVSDIASRAIVAITNGLATAFAPRQQAPQVLVTEPPPQMRYIQPAQQSQQSMQPPYQQQQPQAVNGLPETTQPGDNDLDGDEDEEIDMIEDITKLLLSEEPLSLDNPLVFELEKDYPQKFRLACVAIATQPSMTIIQYICGQSDFAADMFQSSITGPHLRRRLEELKTLILNSELLPPQVKEQLKNAQTANPQQTESTPESAS